MAHIFADNVREGSVTTGTGDFTLEGGIPGPGGVIIGRTFDSVLDTNDTFDYTIFHRSLNEWEIGVGTYLGSDTFSRAPTSSSNSGSLVNFSSGTKQVFIAPVAARLVDPIPNSRLPVEQSGKTFTSTVTITGESGLRIDYDNQEYSIGGTSVDTPDFGNVIRTVDDYASWYIDTDKIPNGLRIRIHESSSNFSNAFVVNPSLGYARLFGDVVNTVSNSSDLNEPSFPIGHTILCNTPNVASVLRNQTSNVRMADSSGSAYVLSGSSDDGLAMFGTWRARGREYSDTNVHLMQRVA